jgi:hypothetical protein
MKTPLQPVLPKHEIDVHSKEYERQMEEKKLQALKTRVTAKMAEPKESSPLALAAA